MIQHRHYTRSRALRFLLGHLRGGPLDYLEATTMLIEEIAGCVHCWFVIADHLASMLKRDICAAPNRDQCIQQLELLLLDALDHQGDAYEDDDDNDSIAS